MRSVEYFLPVYQSVRQWQDRRVRLQLPLFPSYVFVRIPVRERLRVLEVAGVASVVSFGGHPAPIPKEDIAIIRACLARDHVVQPHRYLKRGQRVRVSNGPLAGLTGIVVRQRNRTRLVISFVLLQRSVAVEIDAADLDPHAATRV
jgi:transcription antitermination factor NusG